MSTRAPYSESGLGVPTRSQDSEPLLGVRTRSPYSESGLGVPLHRCRSGSSRNVNRRLRRFTALHDRCGGEVARDIEHRAEHVRNRIDRNEYPDPLCWKTNRDEERREHEKRAARNAGTTEGKEDRRDRYRPELA